MCTATTAGVGQWKEDGLAVQSNGQGAGVHCPGQRARGLSLEPAMSSTSVAAAAAGEEKEVEVSARSVAESLSIEMDDSFSIDTGATMLACDSRLGADGKLHIDRSTVSEGLVGRKSRWIRLVPGLELSFSHPSTRELVTLTPPLFNAFVNTY